MRQAARRATARSHWVGSSGVRSRRRPPRRARCRCRPRSSRPAPKVAGDPAEGGALAVRRHQAASATSTPALIRGISSGRFWSAAHSSAVTSTRSGRPASFGCGLVPLPASSRTGSAMGRLGPWAPRGHPEGQRLAGRAGGRAWTGWRIGKRRAPEVSGGIGAGRPGSAEEGDLGADRVRQEHPAVRGDRVHLGHHVVNHARHQDRGRKKHFIRAPGSDRRRSRRSCPRRRSRRRGGSSAPPCTALLERHEHALLAGAAHGEGLAVAVHHDGHAQDLRVEAAVARLPHPRHAVQNRGEELGPVRPRQGEAGEYSGNAGWLNTPQWPRVSFPFQNRPSTALRCAGSWAACRSGPRSGPHLRRWRARGSPPWTGSRGCGAVGPRGRGWRPRGGGLPAAHHLGLAGEALVLQAVAVRAEGSVCPPRRPPRTRRPAAALDDRHHLHQHLAPDGAASGVERVGAQIGPGAPRPIHGDLRRHALDHGRCTPLQTRRASRRACSRRGWASPSRQAQGHILRLGGLVGTPLRRRWAMRRPSGATALSSPGGPRGGSRDMDAPGPAGCRRWVGLQADARDRGAVGEVLQPAEDAWGSGRRVVVEAALETQP